MNGDDVDEAINLIKVAMQQAATDPVTGLIDMDIITTGKTSYSKMRVANIAKELKKLMKSNVSKYMKSSNFEQMLAEYTKNFPNED